MSFFEKMKGNAIMSMASAMGFDLNEMLPQVTEILKDFFVKESEKTGFRVLGLLSIDEEKNLVLGLYCETPEGLSFHKQIDISNPKQLLNDLLNGTNDTTESGATDSAPKVISMAAATETEQQLSAAGKYVAATDLNESGTNANTPNNGDGLSEPGNRASEAVS